LIPSPTELFAACEYLARRFSWDRRLKLNLIRKIHSEAAQLARIPSDEPAALFFAFSQSFELLAEDYTVLPIVIATNQAKRLGYDLSATAFELVDLKRAVSAGLCSFESVRRWFIERLVTPPRWNP